jgi:DHA1 family inner membrane transport protein
VLGLAVAAVAYVVDRNRGTTNAGRIVATHTPQQAEVPAHH